MIVMISLTAAYSPAQPRVESGPGGGEWTSGSAPTAGDKAGAGDDQVAKDLFKQMLNMTPDQQAAFLKSLSPDKLRRLGTFANIGSGDKQITAIRKSIDGDLTRRGINPETVGGTKAKGKAAKKGSAKKSGGASGGKSSSGSKPKVSTAPKASVKTTPKVTASKKPTAETPKETPVVKPGVVKLPVGDDTYTDDSDVTYPQKRRGLAASAGVVITIGAK